MLENSVKNDSSWSKVVTRFWNTSRHPEVGTNTIKLILFQPKYNKNVFVYFDA